MSKNIDLIAVRKLLPHGAIKVIAKKAGVLAPTVSRALNGDKRSPKLPDIIKATAEYYTDYVARKNEALEALNKAVNPESLEQKEAVNNT